MYMYIYIYICSLPVQENAGLPLEVMSRSLPVLSFISCLCLI